MCTNKHRLLYRSSTEDSLVQTIFGLFLFFFFYEPTGSPPKKPVVMQGGDREDAGTRMAQTGPDGKTGPGCVWGKECCFHDQPGIPPQPMRRGRALKFHKSSAGPEGDVTTLKTELRCRASVHNPTEERELRSG